MPACCPDQLQRLLLPATPSLPRYHSKARTRVAVSSGLRTHPNYATEPYDKDPAKAAAFVGMASAGGSGNGNALLLLDWTFLNARTRNAQEVQALKSIEAAAAQLMTLHKHAIRMQQVMSEHQAVWQQLLCCQRAELMCLIPMASERMHDLAHASTRVQYSTHTAQHALRSAAATVQMYVNVNRSTADELGLEQGAVQLATSKRELAAYEESVLAKLAAVLSSSMASCAAAPLHDPQHNSAAVASAVVMHTRTAQDAGRSNHGPAAHVGAPPSLRGTIAEGSVQQVTHRHVPTHVQLSGKPEALIGHKRPLSVYDNQQQHQSRGAAGARVEPQQQQQQQQYAHGGSAQGSDQNACKTCSHHGRAAKSIPSQSSQEQLQQHNRNGSSGTDGTDSAAGSQGLLVGQQQQQPTYSAQAAAGLSVVPVTPLACLFQGHILVEQQPQFIEQMHQQQHHQQYQHQQPQHHTCPNQQQLGQDTHSKNYSQA